MKVTPLDLKKAEFKRGFRGYSKGEVQNLLASAAETLEEFIKENMELKQQQTKLSERLKIFEDMEKNINETLIMAQRTSESARQAAEREAELTIAKAEVQAEKIIEGARAELNGLKREMEMLGLEKNAFLVKMRSLVASQWKLLQEEKISEPVAPETEETMQPEEEPAREEAPETEVVEEAQLEEQGEVAGEPEEEAERVPEGDFSKKLGEILKSDIEEAEQEKTEELEQIDETQKEEQKEDKTDVFWGDDEATEGKSDEKDESEKDSNHEAKD